MIWHNANEYQQYRRTELRKEVARAGIKLLVWAIALTFAAAAFQYIVEGSR